MAQRPPAPNQLTKPIVDTATRKVQDRISKETSVRFEPLLTRSETACGPACDHLRHARVARNLFIFVEDIVPLLVRPVAELLAPVSEEPPKKLLASKANLASLNR